MNSISNDDDHDDDEFDQSERGSNFSVVNDGA